MNTTTQLVVVLMIVAAAAVVVVRRLVRALSGKAAGGCGSGCGGCSSKAPLVSLGMPKEFVPLKSVGHPQATRDDVSGTTAGQRLDSSPVQSRSP